MKLCQWSPGGWTSRDHTLSEVSQTKEDQSLMSLLGKKFCVCVCVCVCVCKTVNNLQQKHIIRIFFFSPGIKSQQYLRGEDLEQEEAGPQAASGGGSGVEKGRLKSFLHLRPWLCDSSRPHGLQPTRLLLPWDFPGESTGVGCHCLLRRKKFF